jgi:PncC family amidohydrolase
MPDAAKVVKALKAKGLTLGAIESMTGGLFSATITSVPGASKVFMGGVVTYDPRLKTWHCGVSPVVISECGVVSSEVAEQMARGGRNATGSDICISVTGNAGPTAQEGEAGVGVVYIGYCDAEHHYTTRYDFEGTREEIRQQAVSAMLDEVFENI